MAHLVLQVGYLSFSFLQLLSPLSVWMLAWMETNQSVSCGRGLRKTPGRHACRSSSIRAVFKPVLHHLLPGCNLRLKLFVTLILYLISLTKPVGKPVKMSYLHDLLSHPVCCSYALSAGAQPWKKIGESVFLFPKKRIWPGWREMLIWLAAWSPRRLTYLRTFPSCELIKRLIRSTYF